MRPPIFLKEGDTVGVVAPAGKFPKESLDRAMDTLQSWGFQIVMGKNILSTSHTYFSGSDDERLLDLQEMLNRDDVRAVFCARGGYGTTRILDRIDFSAFLRNPKWIVGFSDITALHLKLHQLGIESVHGPMSLHFFKPEYKNSVHRLKNLLQGIEERIVTPANAMNRFGVGTGEVIGGNLSLLADALGTLTSPDTSNKILIIEEVGEYKYKIDRMLTQLKRAGKLDQLSALVIGHMTDIKDADPGFGESIEEIVMSKVMEYTYPVAFNFPSGHEAPNFPWRHGAQGHLSVSDEGAALRF